MRGRLLALLAIIPLTGGCQGSPDGTPVVFMPTIGSGGVSYRPPPTVLGVPQAGPSSWGASDAYDRGTASPFFGTGLGGWGGSGGVDNTRRAVRGSRGVACDPSTQICYRNGRIDKSETEERFGEGAGDRADDIRDRYGADVYARSRKVVCDRDAEVCYKNGRPDRSETRDVFGKNAARRVN